MDTDKGFLKAGARIALITLCQKANNFPFQPFLILQGNKESKQKCTGRKPVTVKYIQRFIFVITIFKFLTFE